MIDLVVYTHFSPYHQDSSWLSSSTLHRISLIRIQCNSTVISRCLTFSRKGGGAFSIWAFCENQQVCAAPLLNIFLEFPNIAYLTQNFFPWWKNPKMAGDSNLLSIFIVWTQSCNESWLESLLSKLEMTQAHLKLLKFIFPIEMTQWLENDSDLSH